LKFGVLVRVQVWDWVQVFGKRPWGLKGWSVLSRKVSGNFSKNFFSPPNLSSGERVRERERVRRRKRVRVRVRE
jgi:hypothetical protein